MGRVNEILELCKSDKYIKGFADFCRYAMAASFLPTGIVKINGDRFAAGLASNNPLGHYFDSLMQTGFYYVFIGIVQVMVAFLLIFRRTALIGTLIYFPMIINIVVLTYSTRFAGTRANTMLLCGCVFLLFWHYDRLKYILPLKTNADITSRKVQGDSGLRMRSIFFAGVFVVLLTIIFGTNYIWDIGPGNSEAECRNHCENNPGACEFCDCIYLQGNTLDVCLNEYNQRKK